MRNSNLLFGAMCISAWVSAQTPMVWQLNAPPEICDYCNVDSVLIGNEKPVYQFFGQLHDTLLMAGYEVGAVWEDLAPENQKVFVNMEHSWLGDLQMEVECPNGQAVILHPYPNQGHTANLGLPFNYPNGWVGVEPGSGMSYSWTPSPTFGTMSNEALGLPIDQVLISGSYQSHESLSLLDGCPMNGVWRFRVRDYLGSDNGYLFSWGIDQTTEYLGTVAIGSIDHSPAFCFDVGSIVVHPTGGIAETYTFRLNSGGLLLEQGDWDGSEELVFSGLLPGSYTVEAFLEDSLLDEVAVVLDSEFNPATSSADVLCAIGFDPEFQRNVVLWAKDDTELVASYDVYRESSLTSEFEWVGNVHVDSLSEFVDVSFDPGLSSTRYELVAIDSCGAEIDNFGHHRTIHLQASPGLNGEVNLYWNAYEGIAYPNFSIFRSTDGVAFFQIGTVSNSNLAFTDPNPPSGNKWYQVRINLEEPCEPQRSSMVDYIGSNISDLSAMGTGSDAARDMASTLVSRSDGWGVQWSDAGKGVRLTVFDTTGRKIHEQTERVGSGEVPLVLPSGMFIIQVLDLHTGYIQVHRGVF